MTFHSSAAALAFALALGFGTNVQAATPAAAAPRTALALQKTDVVTGAGKAAAPGATVSVHYTAWLYAPKAPRQHGARFDSSEGGAPFTFKLGAGQVIKGWDQGLAGMKAGGRRTLVVPAALAYGAQGAGPIPPNANLIFDIKLVDVK